MTDSRQVINYGIIGFGGIAEQRLAKEGFALDPDRQLPLPAHKLVAATDIQPSRESAAKNLGLQWFSSSRELLASDEIEAVIIASSNTTHYPLAREALLAGKHVFMEKPLTAKLSEAKELSALAQVCGLSLGVDHMMEKNLYNKKAQELIGKGAIGEVQQLVLHMEFLYGRERSEAESWRCSEPDAHGGPIGDVGTHCLYMAEFLLGSPIQWVFCAETPKTLDIAVENGAIIAFKTVSGIEGSIRVAFNQARGDFQQTVRSMGFEAYGTKGMLSSKGTLFQLSGLTDEPVTQELVLENGRGITSFPITAVHSMYAEQIAEHAESIRTQKPLSGERGVTNLRLMEACYRSAREHQAVDVREKELQSL